MLLLAVTCSITPFHRSHMPYYRSFALSLFAVFVFLFSASPTLANPSRPRPWFSTEAEAGYLSINLHLTFAPPLLLHVIAANSKLAALANETVRFPHPHTPHVTLYMSLFPESSMPDLLAVVEEVAKSPVFLTPCTSKVSSAVAIGSYSTLPVAVNDCLQSMSDIIVRRTHHLALANQTAPAWLLLLPEPQRSMKMEMLDRYGSPNVFTQFDPHVTLACAPNATLVASATRDIDEMSLSLIPLQLRASVSGVCGTVFSDQTLLSVDLPTPSNSSDNASNNSCAAFKVVSLKTGSSSSCIGGNTHVWPLLPDGQCHGWSAVDTSGNTHENSANGMRCNGNGSFSFVQFAGSLDCSGSGREKTFSNEKCEQVLKKTSVVMPGGGGVCLVIESLMMIFFSFALSSTICRIFLQLCGQLL